MDRCIIPSSILHVFDLESLLSSSSVSLLRNREFDTFTLWQRNPWFTSLGTDDENVGQSGDESVLQGVLNVHQVETSLVLFSVGDNTNTSQVTTTGNHNQSASVKLDKVGYFTGFQVDLDGVVGSDQRIRVSDGSTVVGNNVWNTSLTQLNLLDLTQLVGSLFSGDSMDSKSTLDIVHQSEVLVGSLQGDDIHETSWESGVGSNLTVNLDVLLHQNSLDFSTVQSILESVSQENNQRQRFSQLVRTSRWSWGISTGQFVQHPVGWSCQSLKVLLSKS